MGDIPMWIRTSCLDSLFFKIILALSMLFAMHNVHSPGLCFVGVLNKHIKRARGSKWKSFYALWTSIWSEGGNIWKRGKICNNVGRRWDTVMIRHKRNVWVFIHFLIWNVFSRVYHGNPIWQIFPNLDLLSFLRTKFPLGFLKQKNWEKK